MITKLSEIPALTESWIAPLRKTDRELYDELAQTIVIHARSAPVNSAFSIDPTLAEAVATLDLNGKDIGNFNFRPIEQTDKNILVVGAYGLDDLYVTKDDTGLLKGRESNRTTVPLARNFAAFLIGQCNAYDVYKRLIVKKEDVVAYRNEASAIAASGLLPHVDIEAIFEAQLKA